MRKESRKPVNTNLARVQGYHEGGYRTEAYAFRGFNGNYYLNSDRKIPLDDNYQRADGQPLQGFGLEIETECKGIRNQTVLAEVLQKVVFPVFKFGAVQFKMQEDGSLGGDTSAEIITQVMTKSRIRNDYASYKTMFNDYFPAFGISADSYTTSCGMHVNVSNAVFGKTKEQQEEAIRKLYYIINKHYLVFVRAFYRCPSRTHWCGRMDYSRARTMDLTVQPNDHTQCLNLSHYNAGRIEIRLVGGQKDYWCFRNTMETVFFLTERVRSISWEDCDDIVKIFSGCNQYVLKRLVTESCITVEQHDAIRPTVKVEDLDLY